MDHTERGRTGASFLHFNANTWKSCDSNTERALMSEEEANCEQLANGNDFQQ